MEGLAEIKSLMQQALGLENLLEADQARQGVALCLELPSARMGELAALLKEQGFFLEFITAVDRIEYLELVYMFSPHQGQPRVRAVAQVAHQGFAPSLSHIFPAADWQEREVFDMFGLFFAGHPHMQRILLPQDADFHPLLHGFRASEEHGGDQVELETE